MSLLAVLDLSLVQLAACGPPYRVWLGWSPGSPKPLAFAEASNIVRRLSKEREL